MATDLIVQTGTQVTLNDNPPQALAGAMDRIQINSLKDLVTIGLVSSPAMLGRLLDSAKDSTTDALTRRETYTPMVTVHGTRLPDLRRYGSFRAATAEVDVLAADMFWRVVRDIPPTALATLKPESNLSAMVDPRFREILKYLFKDVEVQSNAVLTLAPMVQVFQCNNLVIHKGGKIAILGNGALIRAFSVQGNV